MVLPSGDAVGEVSKAGAVGEHGHVFALGVGEPDVAGVAGLRTVVMRTCRLSGIQEMPGGRGSDGEILEDHVGLGAAGGPGKDPGFVFTGISGAQEEDFFAVGGRSGFWER